MTVDLAIVDYWASAGRTTWHHASAGAKLVLAAAIVLSAIASTSLPYLVGLYLGVWALVLWSRLPVHRILGLAIYPALFILLFIVSRWDGSWTTAFTYLVRALTTGLVAIWLAGTTPYPDLFAPLSRLLPRMVGDALFLTYRAFFTLIDKLVHLATALRLRGGFSRGGMARGLKNLGEGLGTLVLFSAERSERIYAVMQLRGHSGRVCGCRHWASTTWFDLIAVALGSIVILSALWSAGWLP